MKVVITGRNYDEATIKKLEDAGNEVIDYSTKNYSSATSEQTMIDAIKEGEVVICGLEPLTKNVIDHCPNIKLISRRGIGYDNIDIETCKQRGITVVRTLGEVEGAVAEHVMAYILCFSKQIEKQSSIMHQGKWERIMVPGAKNRTLGLVGFGGIGKEIAKRAVPFGMKVVYYCRHPKQEYEDQYNVKYLPLEELLKTSDYVSVNVPLTDTTKEMFNKDLFSLMKKDSVFINISRGQIMNEKDLRDAIMSHQIKGAGIDVFSKEPCNDSLLVGCPNVLLTPHTAPFTSENFISMNDVSAQNIIDYMNGSLNPDNIVE